MKHTLLASAAFVLAAGAAGAECNPAAQYPKVCSLGNAQTFDPEATTTTGGYTQPVCGAPDPGHETQIKNAFECAPGPIQASLMSFEAIYVLPPDYAPTDGGSFGLIENKTNQHADGKKYVFLSPDVLGKKLSDLEEDTHNEVLRKTNNNFAVTYKVDPDTNAYGLLSVIVHEAAHVTWYDKNIAANQCYIDNFAKFWDMVPNRPWVDFADDGGADHKPNSVTRHPKHGVDRAKFHLNHARFASVFAAISPEEDFVETYKLYALQALTEHKVITNRTTDMKKLSTKSRLANRLDCFPAILN